ncbi:hypothetical protein QCA50_011468 [Cerrena zonata]|uniref:ATP synthase F0 subunit 8 n=1 Tax=Cerrena zonata TaxID=2478898 RepID=A0AAW0FFS3_9APHY
MASNSTVTASQTHTASTAMLTIVNYFTPQNLIIMILMPTVAFMGGLWLGLRWLRWMARNLSAHSIEVALEGGSNVEEGVPEFFPARDRNDVVWTPNGNIPDQRIDEKGQAALPQ